MKNFVSRRKLIQMPVSIGRTWMTSSSSTAGASSAYGNHQPWLLPARRAAGRAPFAAPVEGTEVTTVT